MAKYEIKTKKTEVDPNEFINTIEDKQKAEDCKEIMKMMEKASGHQPKMWGAAIIGYGSYRYVGKSGASGDWPIIAVAPRKQNISIMMMNGYKGVEDLLAKLGKHKTGVGCLYIKRLGDIDKKILNEMIVNSVKVMREKYNADNQ